MFGLKKRKKLDPRVRFQHEQFTRKLDQQKNFQRRTRPVPEGNFGKFLSLIGLESLFSRVILTLGLLIFIYIVYIPNFLFFKDVKISGIPDSEINAVRQNVDQFFKNSFIPLPQKNYLFLDSSRLSSYITDHNQRIWKVTKIKKKAFNKLEITLEAKQEKYFITDSSTTTILFNDGSVARKIGIDPAKPETSAPPGLIKILTDPINSVDVGQDVLTNEISDKLQQLAEYFSSQIKLPISYVSFASSDKVVLTPTADTTPSPSNSSGTVAGQVATPTRTLTTQDGPVDGEPEPVPAIATLTLNPPEFYVYSPRKEGSRDFRILFDAKGDLGAALAQLKLLLGTLGADKMANLVYVDLRLPDRAYVCMINTPCANSNAQ